MSGQCLKVFLENIEFDLLPLYIANTLSLGWLGFLTLSMVPEANMSVIPEGTAGIMILLTIHPFLSGATAAINEWRDAA